MEQKQKIRYEAEPKPVMEGVVNIMPDTSYFENEEKAKALIINLGLKVGDTIREGSNGEGFIINPKMVLTGNTPEYYIKHIEEIKKILTKGEILRIDRYIKRKKADDKLKDKIYYSITKRTDKFYWRFKIKKSVPNDINPVLEWLGKNENVGLSNTIYHLLDKDRKLNEFALAWEVKKIPNTQEWREESDGEYMVLTDSEANSRADDYLDEDYWKEAVRGGHTTEGFDDWKENVINAEGRGHTLNSYDGIEEEESVDGNDYYIYRTN